MTLLAMDGLNVVRRIYEAIPTEDSPAKAVGALKSSLASFKRAMKEIDPAYAVIAFDHGGKTWRHELYSEYKIGRKPMPEHLHAAMPELVFQLQEAGFKCVTIEGVEADDVIAALVERWCLYSPADVTVLSTDKDMLQLVTGQVKVRDHFTSTWRDEAWVQEKFGIPAHLVGDYLALMGDASDGVPGIENVGKVTAVKLLKTYGNLDGILKNAHQIPGKTGEHVRKGADMARLSRQLVGFKTDIKLGLTWRMLECASATA